MPKSLNIALVSHPADIKATPYQSKQWVDVFKRNLTLRLQQLTAVPVNIQVFIAEENTPLDSDAFTKENPPIFEIILPIYSKRFFHSTACIALTEKIQQEQSTEDSLSIGIFRHPLEDASLPIAIRLSNKIYFWRKDIEQERIQLFEPGNAETERLFWGKIDDCANEIYAHWLKSENPIETEVQSENGTNSEQVVVFLAECGQDMVPYRDLLKRDLSDKGVRVLPEKTLPTQISELNSVLKPLIAQCDFSIHMLGADYGNIPEGSNRSIVEIQNDLTEEILSKVDKKRYLWVPQGVIPSDDRQRILIDDAKTAMKSTGSAEVVVGVIEIFKGVLEEAVNKLVFLKRKIKGHQAEMAILPKLYIVCDYEDREALLAVKPEIEQLGCEVVFSAFEESETRIRTLHMEHLRDCAGVLFYFNHGSDKWLKTRILETQRVKAYGREHADFAKAIGIGPKRVDWMEQLHNSEYALFDFNTEFPKLDLAVWIQNWNNK